MADELVISKLVTKRGDEYVRGDSTSYPQVSEIFEHKPGGPGDCWYYDVHLLAKIDDYGTTGTKIVRVFDPAAVEYMENN